MPITLTCAKCGKKLRVPDDAAGKRARCPACQETINIPAASSAPSGGSGAGQGGAAPSGAPMSQGAPMSSPGGPMPLGAPSFQAPGFGGPMPGAAPSQQTPQNPYQAAGAGFGSSYGQPGFGAPGFPQPDPMGGMPMGGSPFGGEAYGGAAYGGPPAFNNPYAAPQFGSPPVRRKSSSGNGAIVAPGVALLIIGVLSILYHIFSFGITLTGPQFAQIRGGQGPQVVGFYIGAGCGGLVAAIIDILMVVGGINGLRMRGRGMAITGAICALIPCSLMWPLNLGIGIWSLVIYCGESAKKKMG